MKWFEHDARASDDPKIKLLKYKYGIVGYGTYFHILEIIARDDKNKGYFPYSYSMELLSLEFQISEEQITNIIEYCVELGLFDQDQYTLNKNIYCPKLLDRADTYTKRVKQTKNVQKSSNTSVQNTKEYESVRPTIHNNTIHDKTERENKNHCAVQNSDATECFFPLSDNKPIESEIEEKCHTPKSLQTLKRAINLDPLKSDIDLKAYHPEIRKLFSSLGKKDKVEELPYYQEAIELNKAMIDHYGVTIGTKPFKILNNWAKEIRLLCETGYPKEGLPPQKLDQIQEVRKWVFSPHCPHNYVIQSASSLREKFTKILIAMENQRNKGSPVKLSPFQGVSGRAN
jgi:hypothetical protein